VTIQFWQLTWSGILAFLGAPAVAPLAAALGWFVAAKLNYRYTRRVEDERRDRTRAAARRLVGRFCGLVLLVIEPFFWIFKRLQTQDAVRTFESMLAQANSLEIAATLTDAEYKLLNDLLVTYGRATALCQRKLDEARAPNEDGTPRIVGAIEDAQTRLICAQSFKDCLEPLRLLAKSLAVPEVLQQIPTFERRADESIQFLSLRIANVQPPH